MIKQVAAVFLGIVLAVSFFSFLAVEEASKKHKKAMERIEQEAKERKSAMQELIQKERQRRAGSQ